jgi:hypothetical protein
MIAGTVELLDESLLTGVIGVERVEGLDVGVSARQAWMASTAVFPAACSRAMHSSTVSALAGDGSSHNASGTTAAPRTIRHHRRDPSHIMNPPT